MAKYHLNINPYGAFMAKLEAKTSWKKLPLAAIADEYYSKREERYKIQRELKKMEELEKEMRAHIIEKLAASKGTSGVSGKLASVLLVDKEKIVAEDWALIDAYAVKTKSTDLYQRRLSDEAVKERWEKGVKIPGIAKMHIQDLSVSKL
jgi:hypothetical protein